LSDANQIGYIGFIVIILLQHNVRTLTQSTLYGSYHPYAILYFIFYEIISTNLFVIFHNFALLATKRPYYVNKKAVFL